MTWIIAWDHATPCSERLPHDQRCRRTGSRGLVAGFGSQHKAEGPEDCLVSPPHFLVSRIAWATIGRPGYSRRTSRENAVSSLSRWRWWPGSTARSAT